MPSATGSLVRAEAWAIGAEPCPASLENRPRLTPRLSAKARLAPRNPPVAAEPVKASRNTEPRAGPTCSRLVASTAQAPMP